MTNNATFEVGLIKK